MNNTNIRQMLPLTQMSWRNKWELNLKANEATRLSLLNGLCTIASEKLGRKELNVHRFA